jgi:hypothetical protein
MQVYLQCFIVGGGSGSRGVPLVPLRLLLLRQRPVFRNRPIFVQDQLEKGSQHTRVFMNFGVHLSSLCYGSKNTPYIRNACA